MTNKNQDNGKIKNLEAILKNNFYQNIVGSLNLVSDPNSYGSMGYQAGINNLDSLMNDKTANEISKDALDSERKNGMYYSAPREYYVEREVKGMIGEAFYKLPLENLVSVLTSQMKGLKLDLREDAKGLSLYDAFDEKSKISEELKEYVGIINNTLNKGYNEYMTRKQISPDYLVKGLNEGFKELNKKYSSGEKK